jgi:hypothetical protein
MRNISALGWVTSLLHRITRSFGRGISPAGIWNAILGALIKTTPGIEPIVGDQGARRALEHILRRLDGSKDLVIELAAEDTLPPVCVSAPPNIVSPRVIWSSSSCCAVASTGFHRPAGRIESVRETATTPRGSRGIAGFFTR